MFALFENFRKCKEKWCIKKNCKKRIFVKVKLIIFSSERDKRNERIIVHDKTMVHKANHGTLGERHAQGNHI